MGAAGESDETDDKSILCMKIGKFSMEIMRSLGTVVIIMFVFSGGFISVEGDTVENNFFISFYFVVVSVTTVGYGEIHPTTNSGRLVMLCAIFVCIVMIPLHAKRLSDVYDE